METKTSWESLSLAWIHRVREAHYEKTKALPLDSWLRAVDPAEAVRACEQLGLKVRIGPRMPRKPLLD